MVPDRNGSYSIPRADLELHGAQSPTAILIAIADSKLSVEGKIDALTIECELIRHDMDKFIGRLAEAEHCVSAVEDTTASTIQALANLQQKVKILMTCSENSENRLWRNNVRVVRFPEGAEGPNPVLFAEAFFKQLLGLQHHSQYT